MQSVSDDLGAVLVVYPRDVRIVLNRAHENSVLAQLSSADRTRATEAGA